jgi:glycine oxidase
MKIVIIGAGVAGLAIGWRLAQAGQEVIILERAQPASGATWASAGMIAVTAEMEDGHAAEIEFAHHSNALWPEFAATLEAKSDCVLGYARSGALIVAEDAPALARLERRAADGLALLNAAQLRDKIPLLTAEVAGALWVPQEAHVDSRALGVALTLAFQKAGGILKTNEAVVRIERRGGRAAVAHTPFGLYAADLFVLAAGAWSGLLEEGIAPIAPVKGEMIALTPPPGVALPAPVIWGHGIYAVPRGGQMLVGATVENAGFDTSPTQAAREALRGAAEKLMPGLKDWTLAEHWAGLRPRAPDGLPLLGPSRLEGLWLASGQYRNGILFAPAIAENLVGQILGREALIPAFDPRRFQA